MWRCRSPHVLTLFAVVEDAKKPALVLEYMALGPLLAVLRDADNHPLPWIPVRWRIALDVAAGLSYLHGIKVIHQDLKSGNVLLDDQYCAKICDFGLSHVKINSSSQAYAVHSDPVGTMRWSAPETLKRKYKFRSSADIYSMGIVLWELAARKLPFAEESRDTVILAWVKDGEREEIPDDCPSSLGRIIEQCWHQEASERPSAFAAHDMLKHAFEAAQHEAHEQADRLWHLDRDLVSEVRKTWANGEHYRLVNASRRDLELVMRQYQTCPVPGMEIASVQLIYAPEKERLFMARLRELQNRHGKDAFRPQLETGRQETARKVSDLVEPFRDATFPNVSMLPVWHGTSSDVVASILETGFANLATTDSGFFGKGVYGTPDAEYAYRVYARGGTLLLNWFSFFSPFPVLDDGTSSVKDGFLLKGDMQKLFAKGNYSNFDAHVAFVVPADPSNPNEAVYYPIRPGQAHRYTEVVVFESSQSLPRYVVQLRKIPVSSAPAVKPSLLFSPPLLEACESVWQSHLSKPFSLKTANGIDFTDMDWNFGEVQRPNHGLCHTLRTMAYLPRCVEAFVHFNALPPPLVARVRAAIPLMQLALLFYVVCRENEAGTLHDAEGYYRFRENSARAFESFDSPIKTAADDQLKQQCAAAIRDRGYPPDNWVMTLITMSHDLDLMRCLSSSDYNGVIVSLIMPCVGADGAQALRQYAAACIRATGDRLWAKGKIEWSDPPFAKCSKSVKECLQVLASVG